VRSVTVHHTAAAPKVSLVIDRDTVLVGLVGWTGQMIITADPQAAYADYTSAVTDVVEESTVASTSWSFGWAIPLAKGSTIFCLFSSSDAVIQLLFEDVLDSIDPRGFTG